MPGGPPVLQVTFSVLALVAAGGSLLLLATRLATGRSPLAAGVFERVEPFLVPLAWLVAAVSMAGSLYFSEVANYEPCRLCWFQRVAMYPLAVILLVGWRLGDRRVRWYAVPISLVGGAISAYHYYIEWNPESDTCSFPVPCTFVWFQRFGFVSLALMALCGFVSITILLLIDRRRAER